MVIAWPKCGRTSAPLAGGALRGSPAQKSPGDAGALELLLQQRSVIGNNRATPVEAIDQGGRDRLVPVVGADVAADRQVRDVDQLVDGLLVVVGRTIFGLHEPAGSGDAEDVQVVLDAAADEPAVAIVAGGVSADVEAAEIADEGPAA